MIIRNLTKHAGAKLATGTGIVAVGNGGRLLLQIVLFVLVARMLGATDYGAFISITTLVAIVSTFAGLSCEIVLVKNVSRDPERFGAYFGNGLALLAFSAPVLVVVAMVATYFISGAHVSWPIIALIAIGDLFFLRVNLLCAACYQAVERVHMSAVLNIGFSACRLGGALAAALLIHGLDIVHWAFFYTGSAVVAAIVSYLWVVHDLGAPRWHFARDDVHFGFHSSLQSTLYFTLRDIDKPLLSRLASLHTAGTYAAAFRIADAAIVPIRALMYAAYAKFFRHGARGVQGSSDFALRLLPFGLAYGVFAGCGIMLLSYCVPWILGPQYGDSAPILRVFVVLPVLHAAYNIAGDALTTSGHQSARSTVQAGCAGLMIALCLVLIPRYGALGAAFANMISHGTMAVLMWGTVLFHRRRASLPRDYSRAGAS